MNHRLPAGFQLAGLHCGIKQQAGAEDLCLVVADQACVGVGVYTQNQVVAAPVIWDRKRTPSNAIRAIIANSGNANACTGARGDANTRRMAARTAELIQAEEEQVLVLSTGIIGEHLPMDCIERGIADVVGRLSSDSDTIVQAARGLMTTDTYPKIASRTVELPNRIAACWFGMAKGAAMIGPNMATMLAVILTDAPVDSSWAQQALRTAVDQSFNRVRVEGHTSTNDTVLLLANPHSEATTLDEDALAGHQQALNQLCIELAKMIPHDGEGATHLIQIDITNCRSTDEATQIARAVADSPLVKTAIAGADPNWGRIVSAAGYAGVDFDPQTVRLRLNGTLLYESGQPIEFDETAVSDSIRQQRDTFIELSLGQGSATTRMWTCDLTAEYVRLNADYHT